MNKSDVQEVFSDARRSIIDSLENFVSEHGGHVKLSDGCTNCIMVDDNFNSDDEGPRTVWFITLETEKGGYVKVKGKSVDGYPDQLIFGEDVEMELWELTADELYKIIEALPE